MKIGSARTALVAVLSAVVMFAFGPQASGESPGIAFEKRAGELTWAACPEFMPQGCGIAVLQGDPAGMNSDIFFRLPGGATAPRHWHNSAERMVLLTGELEVTYDDQAPALLTPGTYAYGPAQLPHIANCRSTEPCLLFIAFIEPVDAIEGAPH